MRTRALIAIAAMATLVGGCATTGSRMAPVDVTRYHLSQPIPAGTLSTQPIDAKGEGPEFQLYADAVAAQMGTMGFGPAPASTTADYVATVGFSRTDRGQVRTRPPVTIGIGGGVGGGGYGGGGGVGGSVGFGVGGKSGTLYGSELTVQLRRRGDNTVIWEGRAVSESLGDQPADSATRLAAALFRGFPGQSGITITVK